MSFESWERQRGRDDAFLDAEAIRTRAMKERRGRNPGPVPKAGLEGSKVQEAVRPMPGGLPGGYVSNGDGND